MQKFLLITFLLLSFLSDSFADEADDLFCSKNRFCKKACDLKRENKYSDLEVEHQELILKCIEGLTTEEN
jgi:hypothetical protein